MDKKQQGILFSRGDLWRSMTAAIFGCGTWRSSERPNGIQKASPISNTTTAQILIDHSTNPGLVILSWIRDPRDRIRSWIPIHFKYYYIGSMMIYVSSWSWQILSNPALWSGARSMIFHDSGGVVHNFLWASFTSASILPSNIIHTYSSGRVIAKGTPHGPSEK